MGFYKHNLSKKEAVEAWVASFDRIPMGAVIKLMGDDLDGMQEVTPPTKYDSVEILHGEYAGRRGEVVSVDEDNEESYVIELNDEEGEETVKLSQYEFGVNNDDRDILPMHGTMWAFRDDLDARWLESEGGLQKMADCGFRIYSQEDYGYIFGIDGAGYDFYEHHWIPLYEARGLHWEV